MLKISTNRRKALGRSMSLSFALLAVSLYSMAQTSLVKWDVFSGITTVTATSYLAQNNGKILTGVGAIPPVGSGFPVGTYVTSIGAPTDPVFASNGWNNGPGTSYFVFNFSTVNYTTNVVTYILGYLSPFGPHVFQTAYSLNSINGPWTDVGSAMTFSGTPPPQGATATPSITLPAACNNVANVWVRVYTTENITQTGNTAGPYIDNIEVKGSAMTAPGITTNPSNSTLCEGADATFTMVASNAISYQWQYRTSSAGTFVNCPNNALFDNETTASLTVNNVTTAMSGYQFQCVVTGGVAPNATTNTATMTVNAYGTWNGASNSNWNNTANWNCGQVPDATTNVVINSGGNQPIVNVANATCNNLTINSGATLTFTGTTNVLDVKGTVSGAGSINGTLGKVVFSGTSAQSIPAGSYKDLQMNGTGGKTLAGAITVSGILTLTSGTITLGNNNLTLTSTGTTTGANANSFVVTNGTGGLINQNIGSGGKTGNINFPIGANTTSYTPLVLNNNAGTADNFTAVVKDGVYYSYSGTTGTGAVTSNAVNKTWHVTEAVAGGSNVTLQLTWNGSNELAGFDRDNCKLGHFTGTVWNTTAPLTFAVGADPYTISRTGITSFSPFGVGSTGSPLPLDLISFTGSKTQNSIQLDWKTVNEKAVRYFDIERSADGDKFVKAGEVAAQNKTDETTYQFVDKANGLPAVVFYRLKMNFETGKEKYSAVVRIGNTAQENVQVYPNPVKDGVLQVQFGKTLTSGTVVITDMAGKVVYKKQLSADQISNGHISVPVKSFTSGNYVLNINTDNGQTAMSAQFIKQ